MTDKLVAALAEFRFWRASVPVGMAILATASLTTLHFIPELAQPAKVFSDSATSFASSLPSLAVWSIVVVACLLLGGWWCSFAQFFVALIHSFVLRYCSLDEDPRRISWMRRRFLPVPQSDLRIVQGEMRKQTEFHDLEEGDHGEAYRSFFSDVIREPESAVDPGVDSSNDALRALAEMRLVAGLLIWIPWLLLAASWHLRPGHQEILIGLNVAAIGFLIALVVATWSLAKRSAGVLSRLAATPERLGLHARLAVNSGRTSREVDEANDGLQ